MATTPLPLDLVTYKAALAYAAAGVPVFPCAAATKAPHTVSGFKDASTDPEQIKRWWRRWPDAMIGMPTGEASGVWVLDVDRPPLFGAACEDIGLVLPVTRNAETGKGYHLSFAWDGADPIYNAQKKPSGEWPFRKLPGAEVRGEGGYVILPPSRHPSTGKLYAWTDKREPVEAPEELLAIVRKKSALPKDTGQTLPAVTGADTPYGLKALRDECTAVRGADEGAQEGALNAAALKIGSLVGAGKLTRATAREELIAAGNDMPSFRPEHPWTSADIEKKVDRSLGDGMKKPRALEGEILPGGEVSEDAIAQAFTRQYRDRLRYDVIAQRWFEWDGTRWARDEKRRAFHYARQLLRSLSKGKVSLCRASVCGGVERLAQCDPVHAITPDEWDRDLMLLGTPKGTVDLRTGELREADPADMITKQTAVAPEAGEPTLWLSFLNEALTGDAEAIRFLQQWFGYCLTGSTRAQALLFIHGSGGTGKGVFLNTMKGVLGDYAVTAAMETLVASKHSRHSAELAMFAGARLVSASETEEGRSWAESRIKQLTGGDPVTAQAGMRKDYFTFLPQFKLTIIGNHSPALANPDEAMRRRFNILGFNVIPAAKDEDLGEKLKAEYGRILSWAIAGTLDWQFNGLVRPSVVTDATAEYFAGQDLIGQWLEERCKVAPGEREQPTALFEDYRDLVRSAGEEPRTAKTFREQLLLRNFAIQKSNGAKYYRGLSLLPAKAADFSRLDDGHDLA